VDPLLLAILVMIWNLFAPVIAEDVWQRAKRRLRG